MRKVPDFPIPGILFRDFTPLLSDPKTMHSVVVHMAELAPSDFSHIASIEARGFILACALANFMDKGFVPVRKKGKLPAATLSEQYNLEYGTATLEVHKDAVPPKTRLWVIDDLLATGGSLQAACRLLERLEAEIAGLSVLVELEGLSGREALSSYPLSSVFTLPAS